MVSYLKHCPWPDQKFCADSKNIYNGVAMVLTVAVVVAVAAAVVAMAASLPLLPTLVICIFLESA